MKEEERIQQAVCDWLKLQYPKVIFKSDLSGIKLTIGQAIKCAKGRSSAGFCDLDILEPTQHYHGLYIELKKEIPFKKDGDLKKMIRTRTVKGLKVKYDHLQEQQDMINSLKSRGYYACFAWSFDMVKDVIVKYLGGYKWEL